MSTALVEMFNNQPMTTSLAIAEGIEMSHASVIKLVRNHINELQEFNPIGFEIRKGEKLLQGGYGKATEFAWLNEGQAIFLLTLQRNTEKVVKFKLALVKAFLELRDRITQTTPHTNSPLSLNHRADIRVAADRTFRSVLRSCRSAGSKLPTALQRANEITLRETGIDMLSELQIDTTQHHGYADYSSHLQFLDSWMKNELPVPCAPCRSQHLYMAYQHWEIKQRREIKPINKVMADISKHCGFSKKKHWVGTGLSRICFTVVLPHGNWFIANKLVELEHYINDFKSALDAWIIKE